MSADNTVKEDKTLREKILERIEKMCLMDDDFMSVVLQHKECMELVLNIILDRTDLKVEECKSQYSISSLSGRSVRLDVLARDSEGKRYDLEVQQLDSGAQPRRARYNSSLMDADFLAKGEDVSLLPESYVIFITENDVLKGNKPIYTVERVISETGGLFNDGTHILYVNSQIQDESALGKLMKDFHCVNPDNMNYSALSEHSVYYKNGEGVPNMCKLVEELVKEEREEGRKEGREEGRKEGREKGREENSKEIALKLLSMNALSLEKISEVTGLSIEIIKELAEKHSA